MKTFKDHVLRIVTKIPKGEVLTYKEVAKKAGNEKAVRVVGNLMAKNQDKNVPCHRVIRSDGKIGKYNGLQGKDKEEILLKEGVKFKKSEKELKKIKKDILNLKKSPLFKYRKKNNYMPVIGEGSLEAKIMFVGEAPGKKEALTGAPFCGASGKLLDELLSSINLKREDVYITNIVKDRPPENRDPTDQEIKIYGPFLNQQIEIIKPKIIATLGRFSMNYVFKKFMLEKILEPISKMHGKTFKTKTGYGIVKIIPLYHPAAAIYNQHLKETLKKDFLTLKSTS